MLDELQPWIDLMSMTATEWTGRAGLVPWVLKKADALDTETVSLLYSLQGFARGILEEVREASRA